jgi:crossover junction endodeoxyribonuclease RuvC
MSVLPNPIILGIDPGTKRIGFGIIKIVRKEVLFIEAGLLVPRLRQSLPKADLLANIKNALELLAKKYSLNLVAVERVYFGRNISSALAVSEVRGAILLVTQGLKITAIEVHPTNVKQITCGYGHADKTSIRKMVFRLINGIPKSLTSRDAIDALAIALAGYYAYQNSRLVDKLKKSDKTNSR